MNSAVLWQTIFVVMWLGFGANAYPHSSEETIVNSKFKIIFRKNQEEPHETTLTVLGTVTENLNNNTELLQYIEKLQELDNSTDSQGTPLTEESFIEASESADNVVTERFVENQTEASQTRIQRFIKDDKAKIFYQSKIPHASKKIKIRIGYLLPSSKKANAVASDSNLCHRKSYQPKLASQKAFKDTETEIPQQYSHRKLSGRSLLSLFEPSKIIEVGEFNGRHSEKEKIDIDCFCTIFSNFNNDNDPFAFIKKLPIVIKDYLEAAKGTSAENRKEMCRTACTNWSERHLGQRVFCDISSHFRALTEDYTPLDQVAEENYDIIKVICDLGLDDDIQLINNLLKCLVIAIAILCLCSVFIVYLRRRYRVRQSLKIYNDSLLSKFNGVP